MSLPPAPARGGDYELHLGQDLSIGYLSHDTEQAHLFLTGYFTFLVATAEAAIPLTAPRPLPGRAICHNPAS